MDVRSAGHCGQRGRRGRLRFDAPLMCNLYSLRKGPAAILDLARAMRNDAAEIRKQDETACLVVGAPIIPVVVTTLNRSEATTGLQLIWVTAPPILQMDYPAPKAEADRERMRSFDPSGGQGR